MTKSEIDRIGDKLRKTQPPDEGLLEQLQQFRAVYDGTMARVHGFVASLLGLAPTSRIKTVNTIVEKLIRSKTRLSSMQDIAGVRVVLGEQADIGTQDVVVAQLVAAFGKAKVDDLRGAPRHGYRAVHVIVRESELPHRDPGSDQATGLVGPGHGKARGSRGPRDPLYGEPPTVERIGEIAVSHLVEAGLECSGMVRLFEEGVLELRNIEAELTALRGRKAGREQLELRLARVRAQNDRLVGDLHKGMGLFHELVELLSRV